MAGPFYRQISVEYKKKRCSKIVSVEYKKTNGQYKSGEMVQGTIVTCQLKHLFVPGSCSGFSKNMQGRNVGGIETEKTFFSQTKRFKRFKRV